jgi:hypothetical protein
LSRVLTITEFEKMALDLQSNCIKFIALTSACVGTDRLYRHESFYLRQFANDCFGLGAAI